jgi:Calcineurin-like phosphoesterase
MRSTINTSNTTPAKLLLASLIMVAISAAIPAKINAATPTPAPTGLAALAETPTSTNSLQLNQQLGLNQYIASTNGTYRFYLQSDGNVVLRNMQTSAALWSANTGGKGGVRLTMQSDGNLVLYTSANAALWSTATSGKGGTYLMTQSDGNAVLYSASGAVVWSTNTGSAGGAGGTGGTGTPSTTGTKIAFVGDTGYGGGFQGVLNLIKAEGAKMTLLLGDTAYASAGDATWDAMARNTLGPADPVVVVVGNHDVDDSNFTNVSNFGKARLAKQSAIKCSGSYATSMTCQLNNIYFVISGVGTTGSIASQESFIANSLNNAPSGAWRICSWHKNQQDMQVGGKTNEVGWTAYETCRQKGAIIATGHEHSYSRTHLLSNMTNKTVVDSSSPYTVSPGNTLAFVSGLGGKEVRDQERSGNWWAKIYTATQGAKNGVLFGTFYNDHADFYFKNINGQIIDTFTVKKGY